ncbi:MAG: hypothetical protein JJE08_09325 [Proteiniphilum sp.]|nr:hypothetical protein [Proteiniphilum sp.]
MDSKYKKLAKCLLLDAVGMASEVIPVVGPLLDIIWAPVAASISYKMFGEKKGKYTSLITFVEELLPVTDVIPSFTIFWFLFDFLGIGKEKETINNVTDAEFAEVK